MECIEEAVFRKVTKSELASARGQWGKKLGLPLKLI